MALKLKYRTGEPCAHPGCASHVSHPCEVCGRKQAQGDVYESELLTMDIPKNKDYPPDAVQCDSCGGHGCNVCGGNGWLPAGHPGGRRCARAACDEPIPPNQVAVYCSNECAYKDA